ncbi:uncharacterized protein LOC118189871 [Stegodyphus dumicola]|uniref:uncharacterized protein LOC118189871 n=1 Tax=Stegodyphus dumicola TaxID=202533 RepID=UPI0015A7E4EB|nr:uncharacterized protein LOC118189871 [Stegodyphus dumicola]
MVVLARTGFGSNHISKKKDTLNKNLDLPPQLRYETSFRNLCVFKDVNGIIRVKTRITERIDKPFFISPILPDKCIFTPRLIEYFHRENCHAGTQILLSIYCVKSTGLQEEEEVENAAAFEVVGIDLAGGPLFVKRGDKVWMVLYTCALYREQFVYLELITSLSTDAFLLSFRRFVARRGRPRVVYTDNGTNFRGAYNNFLEIDWSKITRQTEIQKIEWKFIPPTAAWWGGWWERLVRVVKELLRRTLGRAVLTYEELETVMCECEREWMISLVLFVDVGKHQEAAFVHSSKKGFQSDLQVENSGQDPAKQPQSQDIAQRQPPESATSKDIGKKRKAPPMENRRYREKEAISPTRKERARPAPHPVRTG